MDTRPSSTERLVTPTRLLDRCWPIEASVGQPKVLFSASPLEIGNNAGVYDVSPDSRRFVMIRPETGAGESELVVVQSWFEELRGRVGK